MASSSLVAASRSFPLGCRAAAHCGLSQLRLPLCSIIGNSPSGKGLSRLCSRVAKGLARYAPEIADEGVGGTYFARSFDGRRIAVFKPFDEEPGGINNPKANGKSVSKAGCAPGQGPMKEVVAYLLDWDHFAGVPPTTLVEMDTRISARSPKPKLGSLQKYVNHEYLSCDVGSHWLSVERVHAIAILDLRLMNTDRHGGNILVSSAGTDWALTPIDHSFCLPEYPSLSDCVWFDWISWPQSSRPLSQESLAYVASLDAERDCAVIARCGLPAGCATTLTIGTTLLVKGARAGLTLAEMGKVACRYRDDKQPSALERICAAAENSGDFRRELELLLAGEFADVIKSRCNNKQRH